MVASETTALRRAAEYYVVGGPVQPDRPCYCERTADRELYWSLNDGDFCHVLAARQSGKTSLMARTARRLRDERLAVAVVDLAQIATRERGADVGRWFYSVAHRIARELRLKVDLHVWWQSRANLTTSQRFAEFFWSVVLARMRARVVVFFDDLETALDLPHAPEFLAGLRACHDARATEEEYKRLAIVLLGVAAESRLALAGGQSPLAVSRAVRLDDLTVEEAEPLAAGLPWAARDEALRRVLYWTGGQPYLTQKTCRALARKTPDGDIAALVDSVVAEQFFSKGAIRSEPHLAGIRTQLLQLSEASKTALTLYGRLSKGGRVAYEPGAPAHEDLLLSGLVRPGRHLAIRNRIYRRVFSARWVNQSLPFDVRTIGIALLLGALIVVAPVWYTQFLPRPYVDALRAANELPQAMEAYRDLRAIPGHGGIADRLLADVLARRSLRAASHPQVMQTDAILRSLPEMATRADALLASYWERRSLGEARREYRDAALLATLRSLVDDTPPRRRAVAHLLGEDFARLASVLRPPGPIVQFAAAGERLATVGADGRIELRAASDGAALARPLAPTAQEFVPVVRRLDATAAGSVQALELTVQLNHPRPADVLLTLTAPSGRRVALGFAAGRVGDAGRLFRSSEHPPLAALHGERWRGEWTLTLEDQHVGESGTLLGWQLRSGSASHSDRPEPAVALPDPRVTAQTVVALSATGRYAAVWSAGEEARGDLTVWDIERREPLARIVREQPLARVEFALDEQLLIGRTQTPRDELRIWRIADGREQIRLELGSGAGRLQLDPERRLIAIPSVERDGRGLLRIWDLQQGAWRNRLNYRSELHAFGLNPGGGRIVTFDSGGLLEIRSGIDGRQLARVGLPGRTLRARFDLDGEWLATLDAAGLLSVWNTSRPLRPAWRLAAPDYARFEFAPDKRQIAVETGAGAFVRLRVNDGQPMGPPLRPGRPGRLAPGGIAWSAGTLSVISGDATALFVYDIAPPDDPGGTSLRLAAASDGERLAVVGSDHQLRLWATGGAAPTQRELPPSLQTVRALAFGPAGELAAGTSIGQIALWQQAPAPLLVQHDQGGISALAFSPDGRRLAVGGGFGVAIVDATDGRLLQRLGTNDPVRAVAFAADGALAAGGEATGLRVFDAGQQIELPFSGAVTAIGFSGDGQRVAAGGRAGQVLVWARGQLDRPIGASAVGGPIRVLRLDTTGQRMAVVTDEWIHVFQIDSEEIMHRDSRLLPIGLVAESLHDFGPRAAHGLRLHARDIAEPVIIELEDYSEPPVLGTPGELLEDWSRRLNLAVNEAGQFTPQR